MKKSTNIIIATSIICLIASIFITVFSCGAMSVEIQNTVETCTVSTQEYTTFTQPDRQSVPEGVTTAHGDLRDNPR